MVTAEATAVESCCAILYGGPLVEPLAGESLHPGGLATTRRLLEAEITDLVRSNGPTVTVEVFVVAVLVVRGVVVALRKNS